MRHIRVIRRRNLFVLNTLLFASILLFYHVNSDLFFTEFTEWQLEKLLPEWAEVNIVDMKGELPSRFEVTNKDRTLVLDVSKEKDKYFIKGKIDHLKWQGMDLIGKTAATIDTNNGDYIDSHVIIKDIIINYIPFNKGIEIFLSYDRAKGALNINRFNINGEIEGYGQIRFMWPHNVFLKGTVMNLVIEDYYRPEKKEGNVTGTINGNFTIKGPIKDAEIAAHFDIQNGNLGDLKFDYIIANLKGKAPLISIYDSRIRKEDGYIILSGIIDLSKLKDKKAFEDVRFGPDKDFFVWEGWSVKKEYDDSSVKAGKPLSDEFQLNLKTQTDKKMRGDEEHFLGVEHKIKF